MSASDARETIIRIDHATGMADVWTAEPAWQRLMQRIGARQLEPQLGGHWWTVHARRTNSGVRLGVRQPRQRTAAQLAALAKAQMARRGKPPAA